MPDFTAADVKRLRDDTGAGMMDSKRALADAEGDFERAKDRLRAKGLARAAGKAGRATNEGAVEAYVHSSGGLAKRGALVEVLCESDFVAKTHDFKTLARDLAQHVVGASPHYVRREDVPPDVVEREKAVYRESVQDKPANIIDKILEGKLNDFYARICLLEQPWIKDDKKRVRELVTEAIAKLGENITVAHFAHFSVGEPATAAGDGVTAPSPE